MCVIKNDFRVARVLNVRDQVYAGRIIVGVCWTLEVCIKFLVLSAFPVVKVVQMNLVLVIIVHSLSIINYANTSGVKKLIQFEFITE